MLNNTASAANYQFSYVHLRTITTDGGPTSSMIYFSAYDAEVMAYTAENRVKSAQLVAPGTNGQVTIDVPVVWEGWENRTLGTMNDNNGNNIIENDEKGQEADLINYYRVDLPSEYNPHPAGVYSLVVTFSDDSVRQYDFNEGQPLEAGQDATTLPPLQNVEAAMDQTTGDLTVSWGLPTTYPDGATIMLRLGCFRDGR